jgi:hypothetical protein
MMTPGGITTPIVWSDIYAVLDAPDPRSCDRGLVIFNACFGASNGRHWLRQVRTRPNYHFTDVSRSARRAVRLAGNNPDKKTIFGSYSDDLGVRSNTELQRIYSTDAFKGIFPGTRISEAHTISDRWKRNESLIEYVIPMRAKSQCAPN